MPRCGGTIRRIDEEFAANPVTKTGPMSAALTLSPVCLGFGPQPSIACDSGIGNGPFGFDWTLSLLSITRKTHKGLPHYFDAQDSDLMMLDGLVPGLYEHDEAKGWRHIRPFTSRLNRDTHDPNLKFVGLDGDGHTDVQIAEDAAFFLASLIS